MPRNGLLTEAISKIRDHAFVTNTCGQIKESVDEAAGISESTEPADLFNAAQKAFKTHVKLGKLAYPKIFTMYWLYKTYRKSSDNPFLSCIANKILDPDPLVAFFASHMIVTPSGGGGPLKLDNLVIGNNDPPIITSIPFPEDLNLGLVIDQLMQQWVTPASIMSWLTAMVIQVYDQQGQQGSPQGNDLYLINPLRQVLEQMHIRGLVNTSHLVVTEQVSEKPNWVTFVVYENFLRNDRARAMVLAKIKRAKASMNMVDFIHKTALANELPTHEFRECLYEFVDYNLGANSDELTCVRLLARLITSLHGRGLLEPIDDYTTLFGSFVKWIATVPEAKQVYTLVDFSSV